MNAPVKTPDMHLVLHGLAIRKHAGAQAVAARIGLEVARVQQCLAEATARGRVVESGGRYLLAPLARMALEGEYSRYCEALRREAEFLAAYENFERINVELKTLVTDWQTLSIGGSRVANDHSDKAHDARLIDRLGELHERAEPMLAQLAKALPRLSVYGEQLQAALEKCEDGAVEWFSEVRIDSYHTVWFELHEDLLRLLGRSRSE